jgi:hypothetical protein
VPVYDDLNIKNINEHLKKTDTSFETKYFYLSLLEKHQTFLPFLKSKKNLAIEFYGDDSEKSLKKIQRVLKELKKDNLLRCFRKGNSLFLQLVPPQPFRFLKGEFIQLSKIQHYNKLIQTICLKNIIDLNEDRFCFEFHLITFGHGNFDEALEGMERGYSLYFIAEVKTRGNGTYWLHNEFHLTNDWLMRKQEEAFKQSQEQETTPPPSTKLEAQELAATFSWSY